MARRRNIGPSKGAAVNKPPRLHTTRQDTVKTLAVSAGLLTLAALASPVSQATLAPVFGALPSSVNHKEALAASYLAGYLLQVLLQTRAPRGAGLTILCVWMFWIPLVQLYLFPWSRLLGLVGGPMLIGFLSCHAVVILAVYDVTERLARSSLDTRVGGVTGSMLPAAAGLAYFTLLERWFARLLPFLQGVVGRDGSTFQTWPLAALFSPVNIQNQMALSTYFAVPHLSLLRWLQWPLLLHSVLLNPHTDLPWTFSRLNDSLLTHDWSIVDRDWSNTGYISILESHDAQYRVMRCDHSLLGGEWYMTETRRTKEGWRVPEPIYAVFEMLEAVRLMEAVPTVPDLEAQALVIGLGIGTAPKAFIQHGINTTVVEMDPVVYRFASEYFGLSANHTAVIQDAVTWVETARQKYDYIIHDVFTGGAEPLPLFTKEFLRNLRSLLRPAGVIAINYAGDLKLPLTLLVLNTVHVVFEGQCKMFRDAPRDTTHDEDDQDFLNMVIFCRNSAGPISFRKPTAADFLGSKSRQQYLLPRASAEIAFPSGIDETLQAGDQSKWASQQIESASRHWRIMRTVMPDAIWELW